MEPAKIRGRRTESSITISRGLAQVYTDLTNKKNDPVGRPDRAKRAEGSIEKPLHSPPLNAFFAEKVGFDDNVFVLGSWICRFKKCDRRRRHEKNAVRKVQKIPKNVKIA